MAAGGRCSQALFLPQGTIVPDTPSYPLAGILLLGPRRVAQQLPGIVENTTDHLVDRKFL